MDKALTPSAMGGNRLTNFQREKWRRWRNCRIGKVIVEYQHVDHRFQILLKKNFFVTHEIC